MTFCKPKEVKEKIYMHCSIEAYNDFHDDFMNERIIFYALLT